jgi:two-component system response regulator (stage 0 sporulation protein F)
LSDRKVLIVDDQYGIRALLNEVFTVFGFEVLEAPNGIQGLMTLIKESPDIVVLDMKMPGLSGIDTLREIRKVNHKVPVVLVTAYQETEMIVEAERLGVAASLIKPFDLEELREIVTEFAPPPDMQVAGE